MKAVIYSQQNKNINLAEKINVLGKSLIRYQLEYFAEHPDIDTVYILGDFPNKKLKENGKNIVFMHYSENYLDMSKLKKYLDEEPFFLMVGNVLTNFKLKDMQRDHLDRRANISFLYNDEVSYSGYYAKINKKWMVNDIKFNEKKYKNYINNLFLIDSELLTYAGDEICPFYEKFLPAMIEQNKFVNGIKNKGMFVQFDDPESLYKASYDMLTKEQFKVSGNKINESYYGDKCEIDFSVKMNGKQFFGNNCLVKDNAVLNDNVVGDNVKIGKNCKISDALILNNVEIGDNCEVTKSILGENTVIESNSRVQKNSIISKDSQIKSYSGVLYV